jgi:predicted  nucleic acid-binding Zn-ribbon protein
MNIPDDAQWAALARVIAQNKLDNESLQDLLQRSRDKVQDLTEENKQLRAKIAAQELKRQG